MNKVICDVCGTTFPETSTHCPICGCAKQPAAQPVGGEETSSASNNGGKGGRFAKNNVKRNSRPRASEGRFSSDKKQNNDTEAGSKGLIAVVIILLLAIVMVVVYIGVKVFFPSGENGDQTNNTSTVAPDGNDGGGQSIPCTSIKLGSKIVELTQPNQSHALSVEKVPDNTTDNPKFQSSDPSIVAIDELGNITPVGYGEATITVTCGSVTETCKVVSTVGEPPVTTPPTNPPVTYPDGFKLVLNTYKGSGEITIAAEGDSHRLYTEIMGVKASDITWTSDKPEVATVENGKVVGVDRGTCIITATIGDQTATCMVRCPFDAAEPTPYELSQGSATIAKDETFTLSLKDKETGANVQGIEWHANKEGVVSINGNKITGGSVNDLTVVDVYTEYEGVKYICKVYVKAPNE